LVMRAPVEYLVVIRMDRLINPIAVKKSMIEDRDVSVLGID
jgi:hypothetical protein